MYNSILHRSNSSPDGRNQCVFALFHTSSFPPILFFVAGLCCFSEDDERKVRFQNGHKRPLNVTDAAPKETKMFYNKESKKRRIYRRDNWKLKQKKKPLTGQGLPITDVIFGKVRLFSWALGMASGRFSEYKHRPIASIILMIFRYILWRKPGFL